MKNKTFRMIDKTGKEVKITTDELFGLSHEIYIVALGSPITKDFGIMFFACEILRCIEDFLEEKTDERHKIEKISGNTNTSPKRRTRP